MKLKNTFYTQIDNITSHTNALIPLQFYCDNITYDFNMYIKYVVLFK